MYRGLLHAGAWALTTAAAVTLSWFGVRSVLRSTAYDLPRALPITVTSAAATSGPPVASSTHRPKPTTAPPPPPRPATTTPVPPKTPPGTPHPTASASASAGDVHSYTIRGGRVVLTLTPTAASLVTASPNTGWRMQVWTQTGWLRVTFTSADDAASSSLFCTWNGHPPSVQTYEG